jgi:hypothetical protein
MNSFKAYLPGLEGFVGFVGLVVVDGLVVGLVAIVVGLVGLDVVAEVTEDEVVVWGTNGTEGFCLTQNI